MTHRLPAPAALALGAGLLLGLYFLCASVLLPAGADLRAYSSGILDMDVSRVVADVSSGRPAYRASVHPLQKLLLAPLGAGVNRLAFGGRDSLAAARLLVAVFTAANVLACAWLTALLCGGSRPAAWLAGLLAGVSFSSLLAASIPESAAFAALAGSLPLLLLARRWERPLVRAEVVAWAGLGVLGLGLTLSQLGFGAVAFAVRLGISPGGRRGTRRGAAALAALALCAAAALAASWLQARLYPGTPTLWTVDPLGDESPWLRLDALGSALPGHLGRLLLHFGVIDFAAPFPGFSDFLLQGGFDYWSLSLEEGVFAPAQQVLAAAVGVAVALAAAAGARSRDPRLLAPALCVALQLGLHLCYGREYVLYSPHWHGVLVALLVAGAWHGAPRSLHRALAAAALGLAAAMLANNLLVMRAIYREVRFGLAAEHRDAEGHLRAFGPPHVLGDEAYPRSRR